MVITKFQEFSIGELCAVVSDDGIRDPEPVDDVREEQHRLLGVDFSSRPSLDLLGKFIYGDE
jgi:hypothetical protein